MKYFLGVENIIRFRWKIPLNLWKFDENDEDIDFIPHKGNDKR